MEFHLNVHYNDRDEMDTMFSHDLYSKLSDCVQRNMRASQKVSHLSLALALLPVIDYRNDNNEAIDACGWWTIRPGGACCMLRGCHEPRREAKRLWKSGIG